MSYILRHATLDDVPVICRQRRLMFKDMGHNDIACLDAMEQQFAEWVRLRLQDQTYLAWLAIDEHQQIVAGAGLWMIDWPPHVLGNNTLRGYILNVYTEKGHRRQGLARQLTEMCLDACRRRGIDIVSLHASPTGRALYESMGFAESNEMRMKLAPDSDC